MIVLPEVGTQWDIGSQGDTLLSLKITIATIQWGNKLRYYSVGNQIEVNKRCNQE